ncbi:hypothetical protein BS17DRAFT_189175 [Gyrodon lividus]|nr:hypothetical protein BS17DRAFT_189175 [Gyrodon lividus]
MDAIDVDIDLNLLIGPVEVGTFIATLFLGCSVVQVYVYYEDFQEDRWAIKALVLFEFILQVAHVAALCAAVYVVTVTDYGKPWTLAVFGLATDVAITLSPFIAFGVQCYFTYRLYKFSNSVPLPMCCFILAITRLVLALVVGIAGFTVKDVLSYEHQWGPSIKALLIVSAVCDLMITAGLCYNLSRQKKSACAKTSLVLKKLVIWTIGLSLLNVRASCLTYFVEQRNRVGDWDDGDCRGHMCTSSSFLNCTDTTTHCSVQFLSMPHNFIWMGIYSFSSGIYLNSLLAAVNRRNHARRVIPEVHQFSSVGFSAGPRQSHRAVKIDVSRIDASEPPLHGKATSSGTSMEFA